MALLLTFTEPAGVFGNLVVISPTYVEGGPNLVITIANETNIQLAIGAVGGVANIDWNAIAVLMNADAAVALLGTAVGSASIQHPSGGGNENTGSAGLGLGQFFFAPEVIPPPITNPRTLKPPGGGHPLPTTITPFDLCLARDFMLYDRIDPQAFACGRRPLCFCRDERDWGEWEDGEDINIGPPSGAVDFNPVGAIPVPEATDGDVTIFQFRVPKGYDGIILGQYNDYVPLPIGGMIIPFNQGSGDLVWRVSADGRFVRDCGAIMVSLGSSKSLSTVAGGIQLRSGNLVKYIINAPNLSGMLSPGVGSIVAGLHGYFWPRR